MSKHNETPGSKVRAEVRDYIKNERDTVLMKWLTLGETVKAVDRAAGSFEVKRKRRVKALPMNIQKFIGTLKRCVRRTIKKKGGTPYSIVRALFMYWGTGESAAGTLNADQLSKCINSLGVVMSRSEIDEVISYYASTKENLMMGDDAPQKITVHSVMSYDELLSDLVQDEPTVLMYTGQKYFDGDDIGERFKEKEDAFAHMPLIVKQFVEATQNYVMGMMRTEGGTPHYHIRELFNRFDYNQSAGLDEEELQLAAKKRMKLNLTRDQAREVVKFYDRKRIGQMSYEFFLQEISKGTKPMLDFTEVTKEDRLKAISSLAKNPLMPKPFQPKPNRVLEDLKLKLRTLVEGKVGNKGGRLESWATEAFRSYDKDFTQCLVSWRDVQGVMARLGVPIEQEIALMLLRAYDVHNNGVMHYSLFIKDLVNEDKHFMQMVEVSPIKSAPSATSRTPNGVAKSIQMIKNSCNIFARKSGGTLQARDLLYGTCLRFDIEKCGRIPPFSVMNVAKELNVSLHQDQVNGLVEWFDTNATHALDYNAFTKQLYGSDVMNVTLQLPKLHKRAGKADCFDTVKYSIGSEIRSDDTISEQSAEPLVKKAPVATVFSSGNIMSLMGSPPSPSAGGASKGPKKKSPKRKQDPNYVLLKKPTDQPVGGVGILAEGKMNILAESPAIEESRLDRKRQQVLKERDIICNKLKDLEASRKKLNEDFTKRRNDAHEAQIREKHQAEYNARQAARQVGK